MLRIASIVEGHGECEAVPILVRRIAHALDPSLAPVVHPVIRVPASRLVKHGEIERSVELAARKNAGQGGILVLLDCDDGCPAEDGPALLQRAVKARSDLLVSVVFAKREFEAWFLAAAESLRGQRGLPGDLTGPTDPETIRGAKEWLEARMPRGQSYAEASDEPALTAIFDMNAARRADSFDKCYREIVRLLTFCGLPNPGRAS
ncbi:MAG: DUF4276 family protein [Verrucomicrobiales bacterium]|nr:DUF4276 family protein [Verrucomicrobiales bacterium]